MKAERLLRSVVAVAPHDRRALTMHVAVLEELGRQDEAVRGRAALRRMQPQPLPSEPHTLSSAGLLVTIAGDGSARARGGLYGAPIDRLAVALADRVEIRLPDAQVVLRVPHSVEEGRSWLARYRPQAVLALRGARGFCGESLKDGSFGVTELEATAGIAGAEGFERLSLIERIFDPDPERCLEQVAGRAFERVLAENALVEALHADAPTGGIHWSASAVREVFPGLDTAIVEQADEGRRAMEQGQFAEAADLLRAAERLDPEDPELRDLAREAEATLAVHHELRAVPGGFVADTAAEAAASFGE